MKLAFLGPAGSFSEEAAKKYSPSFIRYSVHSIEEALEAVMKGKAEKAVVPIENSIEGNVNSTLDYLIFDRSELFIEAKINLTIRQNIMIRKDYTGEKIEKFYSHPQAFGQSRKFLFENYPDAELIPVSSTSGAAKMISASNENWAAVGSKMSAETYDLKLIHEDIQENSNNITSFVIVSKKDTTEPKENNITSIVFSTENKPGELYKILDIFSLWDLNLTKIASRPMKNKPGEYVFFIDIECDSNIEDLKDALTMVKRKTSFYKNLGTYELLEI